jgi:hypothetical protein
MSAFTPEQIDDATEFLKGILAKTPLHESREAVLHRAYICMAIDSLQKSKAQSRDAEAMQAVSEMCDGTIEASIERVLDVPEENRFYVYFDSFEGGHCRQVDAYGPTPAEAILAARKKLLEG